jgi:ABC-type antimicrobial peptide transport system permease subunit
VSVFLPDKRYPDATRETRFFEDPAQRAREFGVRLALGAKRGDVLLMVVRDALGRVGLGVAVGLGAALALARLLSTWLFEVGVGDPVTLIVVALTAGAVALGCSLPPALGATRVDPVTTLRVE